MLTLESARRVGHPHRQGQRRQQKRGETSPFPAPLYPTDPGSPKNKGNRPRRVYHPKPTQLRRSAGAPEKRRALHAAGVGRGGQAAKAKARRSRAAAFAYHLWGRAKGRARLQIDGRALHELMNRAQLNSLDELSILGHGKQLERLRSEVHVNNEVFLALLTQPNGREQRGCSVQHPRNAASWSPVPREIPGYDKNVIKAAFRV